MKTSNHITLILVLSALGWIGAAGFSFAADMAPADRQFLGGYEKIRFALAEDDLNSAKKAASTMGDAGATVLASQSLDEARTAFAKLSEKAVKLATGKGGFYIMHCPMVNKDWVQVTPQVGNPFGGKEMAGCGDFKK